MNMSVVDKKRVTAILCKAINMLIQKYISVCIMFDLKVLLHHTHGFPVCVYLVPPCHIGGINDAWYHMYMIYSTWLWEAHIMMHWDPVDQKLWNIKYGNEMCLGQSTCKYARDDSRFVPNQWETALLCNDVSHWLGASLESALYAIMNSGDSYNRHMSSYQCLLNVELSSCQFYYQWWHCRLSAWQPAVLPVLTMLA